MTSLVLTPGDTSVPIPMDLRREELLEKLGHYLQQTKMATKVQKLLNYKGPRGKSTNSKSCDQRFSFVKAFLISPHSLSDSIHSGTFQ